jgi:hypothetical protein
MGNQPAFLSASDQDELDRKKRKHSIYRYRVTGIIILISSFLFLGGIWLSGVNLEGLVWHAGMFDPERHVCLRTNWVNTTKGETDRVRLCTEWIDLTDQSGQTHVMVLENLEVIKGSDGTIRTHLQRGVNFKLLTVSAYLLIILLVGRWIQGFVIYRHKRQIGLI